MLKNSAVKDNFRMVFGTKEDAENYCKLNSGYKFEQTKEWRYYNTSNSDYRTIVGENLIETIEANFIQIMKSLELYGVSGYILKSVKLVKKDSKVILKIEAYPFSEALVNYKDDLKSEENLRIKELEIKDITEEEFLEDEYIFEIKSKKRVG